MKSVDVTAGTIEYREEGDPAGPPVVLLHGLLMNDAQWNLALPHLPPEFRYLLPVLPIGGHRIPMRDDADLTMPGMVNIVGDFLDALELTDVTLVVSDWGGPLFLTDIGRDKRVARLVVCPSEAFDNFPPGFPGKVTWVGTRTTGTVKMAMQQLRVGWLRKRFFLFGMMAAKPIPQDIVEAWADPGLTDKRIRRDLLKYARTRIRQTQSGARHQPACRLPRGRAGAVEPQPRDAGRTCRGSVRIDPAAHYVIVDDAKVLIMLDQPEATARAIGEFLKG